MVPNWTIPNAIALGNCMMLKPSELVPLSSIRIAELLREAGLPEGVFQVVHGGKEAVEAICDHTGIAAVSFVGSTKTAKIVYRRATATLKRCLALGGAKNHLIVMPDADEEMTSSNVVASMSGCAGQRCMAASVMVAVSNVDSIIAKMVLKARRWCPAPTSARSSRRQSKERILHYIDEAVAHGAKLLVDGRHATVHGRENGYWLGPTILDHVKPDMRIAQEEVFGPVLVIIRAQRRGRGAEDRERLTLRKRRQRLHRERWSRPARNGKRERRHGGRERRSPGAARAVLVRRLERVQVRRRRHYGARVDRILDAGEEDDDEVESRGGDELDELNGDGRSKMEDRR